MRNKYIKFVHIVGVCFIFSSARSYSTGIPTVDIANIVQTTTTALEAIEQTSALQEQLVNAYNQYEQLKAEYAAMTGSRGMGTLLDNYDREWAPEDINQALSTIRSGGIPGTNQSYQVAVDRMKKSMGSDLGPSDGYMASDGTMHEEEMSSNLYSIGLSESAYNKAEDQNDEIQNLIDEIDTADDQKAAQDLSNTLLAKMLLMMNESIRLQAAILQNQATANSVMSQTREMEMKFLNKGGLP
ncbi:MAG: type IV secretion system protein [Sedimenticola sp.]